MVPLIVDELAVLVVFDDELAVGIVVMELVGGQMGWQVGVFADELAGAAFVNEPAEAVVVDEAGRGCGFIVDPALAWSKRWQSRGAFYEEW